MIFSKRIKTYGVLSCTDVHRDIFYYEIIDKKENMYLECIPNRDGGFDLEFFHTLFGKRMTLELFKDILQTLDDRGHKSDVWSDFMTSYDWSADDDKIAKITTCGVLGSTDIKRNLFYYDVVDQEENKYIECVPNKADGFDLTFHDALCGKRMPVEMFKEIFQVLDKNECIPEVWFGDLDTKEYESSGIVKYV